MFLDRLFPLRTSHLAMNRSTSCSVSEEEGRLPEQQADKLEDGNVRKKHRRGKKRCRPKWKPYSKMTLEERKEVDDWEAKHVVIREVQINARSKRPVAPFNSTQFLMEDSCENQLRTPRPSRTWSYDSSSSGGVYNGHVKTIELTPPPSAEPGSSFLSFFPPLHLGDDVHYEPSDEDLHEQEAFLEADFNQVYLQLKLNRLEGMSKQDLVSQCCTLEDKVSSIEQEKLELLTQLHQLEQANGRLVLENDQLRDSDLTTTSQ